VYLENDPTLLFVNAGMNQLKDIFLGKPYLSEHRQLMNSQICIRAGGKHNDLDDVGKDTYHLTSFEMLGNWSIGSYDKETTIQLAVDFLTIECGLNINYMYVTYFEGCWSDDLNVPQDTESLAIWSKYVDQERIIPGTKNDNFWSMGNTGPCGPCTEIHYDLLCRENNEAKHLVNKDDPNVIEIWNMVFMMFNKIDNGIYENLQNMYVDTGMGLERLAMILQNKNSVYEIDIFRKLISYAQVITNSEYYTNTYDITSPNYLFDKTNRIFADHIRTIIISLYQGVKFGSKGREFVLRKIFRSMLNNVYINCNMFYDDKLIMAHSVIPSIIIDILHYNLIKKYNIKAIDDIVESLIEEEKYYKSTLQSARIKYKKYCKKYQDIKVVEQRMHIELGIDDNVFHFINSIKD